jgi:FkbH-like protein
MNLDYFELIRQHKTIDPSACSESLRVAVLGDAATQQLVTLLRVLFAERGIRLDAYEGPFDAIELQVYDPSSALYQFAPDVIVILCSVQALKARYYRRPTSGAQFLQAEADRLSAIWDAIRKNTPVPVIQSNFALPIERFFGNFDQKVPDSLHAVVMALNVQIADQARARNQVFINDIESIASYVGRATWFENRLWNMYKVLCALEHLPLVAKNIVDVALSIRGRAIKCVVLDLDNTLWGGVIGDDGVQGIALSAHGDGESFYDFQCFLRELQKRGILLAVCSKNNEENALRPFTEHSDMVLRREHITVFTANWENKADNIRRIRETLNIGFDSMVFLDDNPFERNLVRSLVPGIVVPELPEEPADYVRAVCALNLFETSSFSTEDAQRTELYRQRAEREKVQEGFADVADYLRSLATEINVARFDRERLGRIAQLFQRSNQFNLTTERRTEAECEALMNDEASYPIYAELEDRLGDHGLIALVIARHREDELYLSDWLMSCRVLTRGVEQFLMNHCVAHAARLGMSRVTGEYRPTAKNAMVKDFYAQFGFQKISEGEDGRTTWRLDVSEYLPATVFIRVKSEPLAATDGGE